MQINQIEWSALRHDRKRLDVIVDAWDSLLDVQRARISKESPMLAAAIDDNVEPLLGEDFR